MARQPLVAVLADDVELRPALTLGVLNKILLALDLVVCDRELGAFAKCLLHSQVEVDLVFQLPRRVVRRLHHELELRTQTRSVHEVDQLVLCGKVGIFCPDHVDLAGGDAGFRLNHLDL